MADYDLQYQDNYIDALLATANELKTAGYIYKGVATPSTNPGTPSERVAYLASEPGTYTNFGGIVIASGLYSLTYAGGTWTGTQMQAGSDIEVVQTTGQSATAVMSQKAVTDEVEYQIADILTQVAKTQSNGTIDIGTNVWKRNQNYNGYWYNVSAFQGKKLRIKASGVGVNWLAFATSIATTNNQAINYAQGSVYESLAIDEEKTYIVPSDAAYLYIQTYANGVDRTPQYIRIMQDVVNNFRNLATIDAEIITGGFYNMHGEWTASNNWSSSELISVENVDYLYVSSAVNSAISQVVFFNAVGVIVGNEVGNGEITAASSKVLKIPTGARYAMVSGYTATSIPITISAIYNGSNDDNPLSVVKLDYQARGFIDLRGDWRDGANWSCTDMVSIEDYNYVVNTSIVNNLVCSIAFFDKQGKYLSGVVGDGSTLATQTKKAEKPANARYVIMSGYTATGGTLEAYLSNGIFDNPIKNMKKITLIIIYGQSLSIGADAPNPISTINKYCNCMMLNTGVLSHQQASAMTSLVPIAEASTETPASGTGEMFIEALQKENAFGTYIDNWLSHDLVLACPGVGGATIDELTATSYYQYVENILTAVKNICDANGYTLDIPAWCWVQGEQDTKNSMSASTYKTKLLALQNKYCNSVETITGITERPKCIIYQPSCQNLFDPTAEYNYSYDHMGVPTAFMELLRDNDEFVASIPTYIFDPANSGGVWIHLNEQSYKLLGAYQGYALKRLLIDGERNQGVVPLNISVDDNTITIKYNVPCPPLCFDTCYVNAAPNMGFNVIKSDNTELIDSVSVFNDTITIVCSSSPSGAKLRYGMNGTYHEFISGQYHYYSGAGRVIGARGNLRDNQGCFVYKDIQGVKYPMYNWAYTFEVIL
jgi:hypothetical protein